MKKNIPRFLTWVPAIVVFFLGAAAAFAQTPYPSRPVRLLTAGFGGGSDIASRIIAPPLAAALGQPVVVDSRVGGAIIADVAAKAYPDGYTLMLYSASLWILPLMQDTPAYDPFRDFAPITLVGSSPLVLVVHPSVPAKSVKELIALAKAKPGEINSATGPRGATPHLASELFKAMAGIDIVHIAYRGVGLAVIDVIGGRIQMMLPNAGAAIPHMKSGKLRGLAVGSAQPSPVVPGLPTIAASGLPGYECVTSYGVFAPAGIPAPLVKRLSAEIVRILHGADVKEKLLSTATEAIGSSPAGLTAHMKSESASLGKVIKAAGIRAE